jgi:siroheme synthase
LSTGFVVVSGHAEEAYKSILESLAPQSATVVVLMGLGRMDRIAALLIERGWNALTPAAVVFGASTARSIVWTVTLRELERGIELPDGGQPGTVIVGEVVKLRAALVAEADEGAAVAEG